ncbi:LysR family transcriptional regulator [Photobacterium galatheae]|uniref:LysR family transcriptional regulator n=1 Tax=Photobacterium galatheae TaxID=1654360 RepID=A0A066RMZ2_9GAMM|nr:LysR family transcriptional regulator [Photobacterium galatheae]KDM91689.1 LysR family transcriptional regulator [Photobacterium galatheae]MCM0149799.1 LysR family transcriptional regulator [Photobacterium galatheae]
MDIEALRSFLAFIDTGSFTRAAKQTFRTQSAISMQMKKLEQELEKNLFQKAGRQLVLTHEGQQLASYARRLLSLHDEAVSSLREQAESQPLLFGCPDDYAETLLPYFVSLMRQQLGPIQIQILCASSTRLRQLMDKGELHAAMLTRQPGSDEGHLLMHDQGIWYGLPETDLLSRRPLPIALFQADCKFHAAALDGLIKQEISFDLVSCSSSATAQRGMVRAGLAVGAMARSSMSPDFVELHVDWLPPLPGIEIALVLAPQSHPHLTTQVARTVSQHFLAALPKTNVAKEQGLVVMKTAIKCE